MIKGKAAQVKPELPSAFCGVGSARKGCRVSDGVFAAQIGL